MTEFRRIKKKVKTYRREAGVGALVLGATAGSLIGSNLPGTSGEPLLRASSSFANFVPVAATATGAGIAVRSLKHLKPKRMKRRR